LDRPTVWRTGVNTDSKLIMLTVPSRAWRRSGWSAHTDIRNLRSQAAIERRGATREGVLATTGSGARVAGATVQYSMIAAGWPAAQCRLKDRLAQGER
jgi:RimJ/RimL family protein N-acetyltransferase